MFERGRNYERGLRPSLLNSPLQPENTLVYPLKQAGEGFTLKVLPEGTGVRLSHTNQMQIVLFPVDRVCLLCYIAN